jgi:hypothetical protein
MNQVSLKLAERLFEKIPQIPEGIDVRAIADGVLAECNITANYKERSYFAGELAEAIGHVRARKAGARR